LTVTVAALDEDSVKEVVPRDWEEKSASKTVVPPMPFLTMAR
jgi:hypothetical protein